MYEVTTETFTPKRFLAGDMKVLTDDLDVKDGETITAHMLVLKEDGEAVAYAASTDDSGTTYPTPYGIAAADAENGKVAVWLTGQYFADSIVLPDGVTADDVKDACRTAGIFLVEN